MPVGCLVDSNKRSSRFTGAHWRTRSSEPSAQSQDPQSPQPIRGYTGGLELLVGGAKYSNETRPTTCSAADGRLNGQLRRTSWNTKLCIRWSLEQRFQKAGSGVPHGRLWVSSMGATEKKKKKSYKLISPQRRHRGDAKDNFSQICPCFLLCYSGQLFVTSHFSQHRSCQWGSWRFICGLVWICLILSGVSKFGNLCAKADSFIIPLLYILKSSEGLLIYTAVA